MEHMEANEKMCGLLLAASNATDIDTAYNLACKAFELALEYDQDSQGRTLDLMGQLDGYLDNWHKVRVPYIAEEIGSYAQSNGHVTCLCVDYAAGEFYVLYDQPRGHHPEWEYDNLEGVELTTAFEYACRLVRMTARTRIGYGHRIAGGERLLMVRINTPQGRVEGETVQLASMEQENELWEILNKLCEARGLMCRADFDKCEVLIQEL